MKKLIIAIIAVVLAGLASYFLDDYLTTESDKGQVIIGISNFSIETTFYVFAIILSLLFILFYILTRGLVLLIKSPKIIRKKTLTRKQAMSQDALVSGLLDSAEGNYEKAETTLIKHAINSATPLIHYLTAAKTAHSRGNVEKREEYLRKAYDSRPDSDLTVGITKAELHLSGDEYDQALDTLLRLDQISPGHAVVQRLLHKTYENLNDWESIHKLLPSLQKNKSLMDSDLVTTEVQTYSGLLKQSVADSDIDQLKEIWKTIPDRIKRIPNVSSVYFAGMIESNAGQEIEKDLLKTLTKNWDIRLLTLLESIKSSDPEKMLKQTEKFRKKHPDDATLLCILGRMCMDQNKMDEAMTYLQRSIELEPGVTAHQLLGDLLSQQSQLEAANESYRKGLLLTSENVASNDDIIKIEFITDQPEQETIEHETEQTTA